MPAEFRDLAAVAHTPSYYGARFMGFYVIDPEAGTVLGQFPHFPAGLDRIGYGLDGLTGVRRVTHFWTLLGLVSVYILGARLLRPDRRRGRHAAAAINVIEVWFSGYPNAEVVAQTLLFAAMLAWSRAQVDGLPFFGVVAASLLGMLLFLRVDMVIARRRLRRRGGARPHGRPRGRWSASSRPGRCGSPRPRSTCSA